MNGNMYFSYHMHTMLSNGTTNIDSITKFYDYIDAAKKCGMTALGISEHGNMFNWLKKKEAIEAAGLKYVHCVEAYLTESLDKKIRDNYHCWIGAKNFEGVKELNKLVSRSFSRKDNHFHYYPRISFDELFATSDNILITTACLGGVLNNSPDYLKEKMIAFLSHNKHRCWLEIQHHNCKEQIEYNQYLYEISKAIGIPLITGTDTHALNDIYMDGRALLQKSKNVNFANESTWDLTFKTPEQLIDAYRKQNSLPMDIVYEAMENSLKMEEMIEEFSVDYSAKYPILYKDSKTVFKQKIDEGAVKRGIINYPNYQEYIDRIHYEYDTYEHNGAIDFMLLEENYKSEMRKRNIRFGYSRGSVSGSIIAYLLGITEIDSIKYNLNFERFMNKERVSLADIDTDWYSEDRKAVKDYLYQKEGLYCCDIVTFNTIALKGAIRDVCRGMHFTNLECINENAELSREIKQWQKRIKGHDARDTDVSMPSELKKKVEKYLKANGKYKYIPYEYIKKSEEIISLAEADEALARKTYPEVFKYVDLVNGVVVSVGNHPAACVISPYPVDEWFGTFTTSTDEYPISLLNMKEIDALNFVKLDILGLDNIGLIYKTCDAVGIPFATPDNIPADDINVWNSIVEDTTMIFQWESQSSTAYLKQLMSESTIEKIKAQNPNFSYMDLLSIGNGAIRPAGESYRDSLAQGKYATYGNEALDNFLKPTLGYLVYQEQIIEFLHKFCGYTMGQADIVRRGFAKKTGTEKFIPDIKIGFSKTMQERYGVDAEEADKVIVNFIKVIEDASSYLFSKNHSDPYSWIGYICGYLRYYYPLEFISTALNIFEGKEEKSLAIINYAKKRKIKISPIKFRHSIAQYSFDRETNQIFKGISSIKYMNTAVANEMYNLRNNKYDNFIELLYDLKYGTSINSRQIKILIDLDFFEEFGDANNLRTQFYLFENLEGKVQFKKEKLIEYNIPEELTRLYANKETEKMFTGVDAKGLMIAAIRYLKVPRRSLKDKISAQIIHLGYLDIMDEKYAGMGVALEVDTKYSPKLKMYSLKNGTIIECKISKKIFNKCKLKNGDIVQIQSSKHKPKLRKIENGDFEIIPGIMELWITSYKKVENI